MATTISGTSILLLHGLTPSGRTWAPIARSLEREGARVSAPDLRGHGDDPSTNGFTIAEFARDILQGERPSDGWDLVVAHSLGGAVATYLAANEPGWTHRVLLLDPVIELPHAAAMAIIDDLVAGLENPDVEQTLRDNSRWTIEVAELKVGAARQITTATVRLSLGSNLPWDYTPELARIAVPTLVLGADPSRGAPSVEPQSGRRWAAEMSHVEYEIVVGAGHSIQRDDPEHVLTAARQMLAD